MELILILIHGTNSRISLWFDTNPLLNTCWICHRKSWTREHSCKETFLVRTQNLSFAWALGTLPSLTNLFYRPHSNIYLWSPRLVIGFKGKVFKHSQYRRGGGGGACTWTLPLSAAKRGTGPQRRAGGKAVDVLNVRMKGGLTRVARRIKYI